MSDDTIDVLFVCVGNSARSQMAEGLMNQLGGGRIRAQSCGTEPAGEVHRHAVAVMAELGDEFDISGHRPKYYKAINAELEERDAKLDYIISVCEENAVSCPVVKSEGAISVDWRIPDPAALERLDAGEWYNKQAFRHTRDILRRRIERFIGFLNNEGWHERGTSKAEDLEQLHADRFWLEDVRMHASGFAELVGINPMWGKWPCEVDEDVVFLSMPYGADWSDQLHSVVERAASDVGFRCRRADQDEDQLVMEGIWRRICSASVVVADITDGNPNVTYEVGLADAIGKDVILVSNRRTEVPFNFLAVRRIPYDDLPGGEKDLRRELRDRLERLRRSSSPIR